MIRTEKPRGAHYAAIRIGPFGAMVREIFWGQFHEFIVTCRAPAGSGDIYRFRIALQIGK